MLSVTKSYTKIAVASITVLCVVLAIVGGVIHYSPVPYWDMFDGYLAFFVNSKHGGWPIWWEQHNEHRIVLTRLLFWMDLSWFQGTGWYLIAVNYILAGASCMVFYTFLKERLKIQQNKEHVQLLGLFLFAWLFSWSQSENFIWGFQSQFFLAQLLPLATFYCLHKSVTTTSYPSVWFSATCLLGVASLGTMANGVLALPLVFILSLLLRMDWRKSLLLGLLAVGGIAIYFYDYHSVDGHGSLRQTLAEDPVGMIRYVLSYVGGPFYALTGKGKISLVIAQLVGIFLIISSAFFTIKALRAPTTSSLPLALLTFILYVGGTAFGTAGGRLMFGLNQAVSSRYMTPALMAWAALLILYAPSLAAGLTRNRNRVLWPLLILFALMVPRQLTALRPDIEAQFQRKVAALALELRIQDEAQVNTIYPSLETALALTKTPVSSNLSIFGMDPIKDVSQLIGTTETVNAPVQCKGHVDRISTIPGENRYVSIEGWVYDTSSQSSPESLHIINKQDQVIGYALTGLPQPEVAINIDKKARNSGFKGYVRADQVGQPITLLGHKPTCQLKTFAPPMGIARLFK